MIKIKSIQFKKYPVLGDLCLDFCDNNGNPADTIIIAGENGTGKTIILEEIDKIMKYKMVQHDKNCEVELNILDNDGVDSKYNYHYEEDRLYFLDNLGVSIDDQESVSQKNLQNYDNKFRIIYSNVNINFSPNLKIQTIQTNSENVKNNDYLNENIGKEIKQFLINTENIGKEIKQFLINTDNYGNKIIADKARENVGKTITEEILQGIMNRFKNAFNFMFSNIIEYNGIEDKNDYIEILFNKNGKKISIDYLSSGEKQIVFRGVFLLKYQDALNGAVVLIDEPEISMHPKWQKKILDYYRNLFIDNNGKQTSQIIVSTHSNFVIENALELDNCVIVALQENNQTKTIRKNDGTFILPSVTAEEINYHVFNITSIGYHIQLFGYLHSLMEKHFSKDMSIKEVDNKIKNNQSLLSCKHGVEKDSKHNGCEWVHNYVDKKGNPQITTYYTICCFIRNAIDHPEDLPTQTKKEYIDDLQYSIEILIELIKLAESGSLK